MKRFISIGLTIITGVEDEMRITPEKVFGLLLAVMKMNGFEEAVGVAKNIECGLSVSIVMQDLTEADRFVEEVEAGVAKA